MQPAPRKLTTQQKAVLIRTLREFSDQHVEVHYLPLASDALSYAQDFLAVFTAIGWRVDGAAPANDLAGQLVGLGFVVNEQGSLPASAEALRDSLRIFGIEIATVFDPSCTTVAGGFTLAVGPQA
jgi:hypothetical protein